jgi:hypothetical protein
MGHCPTCAANRKAQVLAEHEEKKDEHQEDTDEVGLHCVISKGEAYRILKCAGCGTVYFQHERLEAVYDSVTWDEDVDWPLDELRKYIEECKFADKHMILCQELDHWPAPARNNPNWSKLADAPLIKLLHSVYTALDHDLRVLAAIGMRGVFERACELRGVDPNMGFVKKLDWLCTNGFIGAPDRENLEVLIEAGNAAAHRGWEPDVGQLHTLTSIMDHFVKGFILTKAAEELKGVIPPRQKQGEADGRDQSAAVIELRAPKA